MDRMLPFQMNYCQVLSFFTPLMPLQEVKTSSVHEIWNRVTIQFTVCPRGGHKSFDCFTAMNKASYLCVFFPWGNERTLLSPCELALLTAGVGLNLSWRISDDLAHTHPHTESDFCFRACMCAAGGVLTCALSTLCLHLSLLSWCVKRSLYFWSTARGQSGQWVDHGSLLACAEVRIFIHILFTSPWTLRDNKFEWSLVTKQWKYAKIT